MQDMTDATAASLAHHFRLVIDNTEGDYLFRCELVQAARDTEYPRANLAEALRRWAGEMLFGVDGEEDALNMMQREMLGAVESSIDWWAMADDYLGED